MLYRLTQTLFGAAGASLSSQFPAFFVQYRQQLAGRLAQLREDLAPVFAAAAEQDLTAEELLARAAAENGEYSRVLVEATAQALARLAQLSDAYAALTESAPVVRLAVFLKHLDGEIAAATAAHFTPALPLSLEGLLHAAIGLLCGLLLLAGCRGGARCLRKHARKDQSLDADRALR
jgi:hypothetical protein